MSDEVKNKYPSERDEKLKPDVQALHAPQMREMAEPTDGFEPTPVWLVLCFFALAGWGGWYLATYTYSFNSKIYTDDPRNALAAAGVRPPEKKEDPLVLGKRVFNNCTQCHQTNGMGLPGSYPPLGGSEWVNGSPQQVVRILLHGIEGPIKVEGATYNQQMPSWSKLRDEQIAAVATYIRASFGNASGPVEEAMVAEIRKSTGDRKTPWSEAELKAAAANDGAAAAPAEKSAAKAPAKVTR